MENRTTAPVVPLSWLPLRTSGRWILDSRNERFQLKCVNWYGASGELHVVHGLHKRTMKDLVQVIVDFGFNCVRLPFSLQLLYSNPAVSRDVLLADPLRDRPGISGMEAYDAAVETITASGLLVLIDNHSSESGWCCEAGHEDGVWFTPHYSEAQWVEALVSMARRYRNNPRVFGIELRNELRDSPSAQLVWGTEGYDDRITADWPKAAELAGNAVLAQNPDLLVVVTGLCYGQDLRGAVDRPVEFSVPGRLVWTSHSYRWFFWWHHGPVIEYGTTVGIVLAVSSVLLCFIAAFWFRRMRKKVSMLVFGEVFSIFSLVIGVYLYIFGSNEIRNSRNTGCMEKGLRDAEPYHVVGIIVMVVASVGLVACELLRLQRWRRTRRTAAEGEKAPVSNERRSRIAARIAAVGIPLLICLALTLATIAFLLLAAQSYWMVERRIHNLWGFTLEEGHPYTAPMLLGEFGTAVDNPFWKALTRYIAEKEISFAYWPLNGEKWWHGKDRWIGEHFGLLDDDWTKTRHDWLLPSFMR